jgi:hypothetical protein
MKMRTRAFKRRNVILDPGHVEAAYMIVWQSMFFAPHGSLDSGRRVFSIPSSFVIRASHSDRFRLRKVKSRGYLKTRVQLDDARQRERGKQRAGRN